MKDHQSTHKPVLLDEVISLLAPQKGQSLLDATAGYGGHSTAILQKTGDPKTSVLIDRDEQAIDALKKINELSRATIIHNDFASASKELNDQHRTFDLILADFGVSSPHLDKASRGFSFKNDGPLDMRMDTSKGLTAADIVNTSSEEALVNIIKMYGEEKHAKRIANAIAEHRPFLSTHDLATTIARTSSKRSKVHPATKTFQALRIAVNDELAQIAYTVPLWLSMLNTGGRIAVISFHSLEDRIVKDTFNEQGKNEYDATIQILTKKPISASKQELVFNPRARSAKLRAAVKK